jgi:hypothetical protein
MRAVVGGEPQPAGGGGEAADPDDAGLRSGPDLDGELRAFQRAVGAPQLAAGGRLRATEVDGAAQRAVAVRVQLLGTVRRVAEGCRPRGGAVGAPQRAREAWTRGAEQKVGAEGEEGARIGVGETGGEIATSDVPAAVPSVTHSSSPWTPSSAAK